MKINKKQRYISLMLAFIMVLLVIPLDTTNASAVKTRRVTFVEQLDGNNRSQTINIPDVSQIVGTRIVGGSTNGTANATITGKDTVRVNVSGGSPSRTANNPQKYSQYVTDYSTSSTDSFTSRKYYSSGGYTGYLNASGGSWVTSGSYTPGDSKYVTGQTSSWYNDGTYSGSLSSYVYSGSYTPADSKYVTASCTIGAQVTRDSIGISTITPSPIEYRVCYGVTSSDNPGYTGKLSNIVRVIDGNGHTIQDVTDKMNTVKVPGTNIFFPLGSFIMGGTVNKPAQDTRVYRYEGTVTKPAVDTRTWRQDYAGTVYKSGIDNYYSYTVDIDYIDDVTPPTLTHTLSASSWTNGDVGIRINASDTQSGVKNIQLPNGSIYNGSNTEYIVTQNGTYTFYSTDNANNKSNAYNVVIGNIDKTNPTSTHTISPNVWTKGNVELEISATDSLSGVKHIELPNGTKVKSTGAKQTITENGEYTYKVEDNAGNILVQKVVISNIDRVAPTNGDLELKSNSATSVNFNIKNVVETQSGLNTSPVEMTIDTETQGTSTKYVGMSGVINNLKPNELVKVKYRIKDKVENISNLTNEVKKYTLAQQPKRAELRDYTGDSITFKYTIPEQSNDAKYRFKAVSSKGKEILSDVYDYDSLVTIKGLEKNEEYTIYATGINNDNVYNEYIKLKAVNEDGEEEDFKVITKNKTEITSTKSNGWNKHTFVANVKDVDLDKIKAELIVGDKVILLDDVLYKTAISEERQLNINLDNTKQGVTRSIEGSKDIFNVGVNLPNGKYKVTLRTTKSGDIQNLELGEYGIDTVGPVIEQKPTLTALSAGRGLLMINTSKIKDLSSSLSEIEVDYGEGFTSLRSQVIINKVINKIKLKDKLGNISEHDLVVSGVVDDNNPPINPGDDDDEYNTGVKEEEIPSNIKDNVVTIVVPSGGSHMQTSLDGVTWSNWEPRTDTTKVTLTSGDGLKSVYVRTGIQKYKETPIFNSETDRVQFITQEGGEVEPFNNMRISKYIMDLTPPKLSVRTMDNSLIAINGNITFLVDIVDNLDEQPKVTLEVLERDGSGTLKANPVYSRTVQIAKGRTTGTITPTKLKESRNSQNKLQPYTLRVTAYDKTGNRSIEHLNFYVKNK